MPRISVCIATYNGSSYIEEQLKSIIEQISNNDEIIISDDSSTDNTIQIIKSFNDSRIKLYENNKFRNYVKNFEFALSKASGKYIFLSDQDDIWLPNKVNKMLEELLNYNLVMSDCKYVTEHLNVFNESYFINANVKIGFLNNFIKNSYLGCCMAFDNKILNHSLPFPNKLNSHDHWIGLIGELYGKTKFIKEPLILFRRHGLNSSRINENDSMVTRKSSSNLITIVYNRINILSNLILNYCRDLL